MTRVERRRDDREGEAKGWRCLLRKRRWLLQIPRLQLGLQAQDPVPDRVLLLTGERQHRDESGAYPDCPPDRGHRFLAIAKSSVRVGQVKIDFRPLAERERSREELPSPLG